MEALQAAGNRKRRGCRHVTPIHLWCEGQPGSLSSAFNQLRPLATKAMARSRASVGRGALGSSPLSNCTSAELSCSAARRALWVLSACQSRSPIARLRCKATAWAKASSGQLVWPGARLRGLELLELLDSTTGRAPDSRSSWRQLMETV